ncbi:tyrosine-type recombinase/integrase [Paenibacillus andongensis]|uniref:tyrosine-type recombinase/integrase n=1 Tax=Paenibacillus andongensis TaxID=2975482 RepID=UPI0021BB420C|nr:site-specific integrase [Paenibacillus andongensis]
MNIHTDGLTWFFTLNEEFNDWSNVGKIKVSGFTSRDEAEKAYHSFSALMRYKKYFESPHEVSREKDFDKPLPKKEDIDKLLSIIKSQNISLYLIFSLVMHYGLRLGEIPSLRWKDINFSESVINVQHRKSLRITTIKVSSRLLQELKNYSYGRIKESSDNDLIFFTTKGDPYNFEGLRRMLGRFLRKSNLDHLNFHHLRLIHKNVTLDD